MRKYFRGYIFGKSQIKKNYSKSVADEDLIAAFYKSLLGRDPDDKGLNFWIEGLRNGTSIVSIITSFVTSPEFLENIPRIQAESLSRLPFINSFSQYKEDDFLIKEILKRSIINPYVVDVGAHSTQGSNSYIFAKHLGWKTLLIEANEDLIPGLKRDFPKDTIILNCAIGLQEGQNEFFVSENSYVSSAEKNQVKAWGSSIETRKVQMQRIGKVLDEYGVPKNFTLLTIDIEGLDLQVLEDMLENTEYRPRYIIAELAFLKRNKITAILENPTLSKYYKILTTTHANLVLEIN
jgi:hypothetical protein